MPRRSFHHSAFKIIIFVIVAIQLLAAHASRLHVTLQGDLAQNTGVSIYLKFLEITTLYDTIVFGYDSDFLETASFVISPMQTPALPCTLLSSIPLQSSFTYTNLLDSSTTNCVLIQDHSDQSKNIPIASLIPALPESCSFSNVFTLHIRPSMLSQIKTNSLIQCASNIAFSPEVPSQFLLQTEKMIEIKNAYNSTSPTPPSFNLTLLHRPLVPAISSPDIIPTFLYSAVPHDIFTSNYLRISMLEVWLVNSPSLASLPIGLYRINDTFRTNLLETPEIVAFLDKIDVSISHKTPIMDRRSRHCMRQTARLVGTAFITPEEFILPQDSQKNEFSLGKEYVFGRLGPNARTTLFLNTNKDAGETAIPCYLPFLATPYTSEYILMIGPDILRPDENGIFQYIYNNGSNSTFIHTALSLPDKIVSISDNFLSRGDPVVEEAALGLPAPSLDFVVDPSDTQFLYYSHRITFQLPIQVRQSQVYYLRPLSTFNLLPDLFSQILYAVNATSPDISATLNCTTGVIKITYTVSLPDDFDPINVKKDRANKYYLPLNVPSYVADQQSFIDIISRIPVRLAQAFSITYEFSTWQQAQKKLSVSATIDALTKHQTTFVLTRLHPAEYPIILHFGPVLSVMSSKDVDQVLLPGAADDSINSSFTSDAVHWSYTFTIIPDSAAITTRPTTADVFTIVYQQENNDPEKWENHLHPISVHSDSDMTDVQYNGLVSYLLITGAYNTPIIDVDEDIPFCSAVFLKHGVTTILPLTYRQRAGKYWKLYAPLRAYGGEDSVTINCKQQLMNSVVINPLLNHTVTVSVGVVTGTPEVNENTLNDDSYIINDENRLSFVRLGSLNSASVIHSIQHTMDLVKLQTTPAQPQAWSIPQFDHDYNTTPVAFVLSGPPITNYSDWRSYFSMAVELLLNMGTIDPENGDHIFFFKKDTLTQKLADHHIVLLSPLPVSPVLQQKTHTTDPDVWVTDTSTSSIHHGFSNTNNSITSMSVFDPFGHDFSIFSFSPANSFAALIFGIKQEWFDLNGIDITDTSFNPVMFRMLYDDYTILNGTVPEYTLYFKPKMTPSPGDSQPKYVFFEKCQPSYLDQVHIDDDEHHNNQNFYLNPSNTMSVCYTPVGAASKHPLQCYEPQYNAFSSVYNQSTCGGQVTMNEFYHMKKFFGITDQIDSTSRDSSSYRHSIHIAIILLIIAAMLL